MEFLWGGLILGAIGIFWFISGVFNSNARRSKREMGEFVGVIDVRREAKNKQRDNDAELKRMRDKYND